MSTLHIQDGFEPYFAGREPFSKKARKRGDAGMETAGPASQKNDKTPKDGAGTRSEKDGDADGRSH